VADGSINIINNSLQKLVRCSLFLNYFIDCAITCQICVVWHEFTTG